MRLTLPYLIFFVWFSIFSCSSSVSNPLNGKHLRVIWPSWSGNPKVLLGPLKGGVLLDYLSARFNFTHQMVPVEGGLEPTVGRGQLNYLIDNQCDLLINNIIPTVSRNKNVDLTIPWTYDNFAILIPVPDETANINAVIKPFQWPIWLGLGVSIVCVIIALNMIQQFLDQPSKKETNAIELGDDKMVQAKTTNYYIYVYGLLLSQGGPCESKRLSIRLVAGVWTLATFIFVQAYSSILFTYVVAPVNRPLINSIYDIFDDSDINLFVRVRTIDLLIQKNDTTALYREIAKRLDSKSNSRCAYISECIQQVTPGSRNIFMEASSFAKDAIKVEFNRTGKCNLQFATEGFATIVSTFALPKQSPYTKTINQGLLELQQSGIIDYWELWFRPMPPQCNGKPPNGNTAPKKKSALSFKNLTGAFIVLLVGLSLSSLAFLCEKIISIREGRLGRSRKKVRGAGAAGHQMTIGALNLCEINSLKQ